MKQSYVYILANQTNHVLYIGVTSNLTKRIFEHRSNSIKGFTQRYQVHKLVYFEIFDEIEFAIKREKQLKAGSREKKLQLIEQANPFWEDLYARVTQ